MRIITIVILLFTFLIILNCDTTNNESDIIDNDSIVGTVPVLNLKGDDTIHVDSGAEYTESGYEAYDTEDGFLTDSVKIGYFKKDKASTIGIDEITKSVDTFFVKYSVNDKDKNIAIKWRCVIIDTIKIMGSSPVIELLGNDTVEVVDYWGYSEPGYTCVDDEDGDLKDSVHSQWFQEDSITTYDPDSCIGDTICFVKYSVVDSDGDKAVAWRCIRFINNFITLGKLTPSHINISMTTVGTVTLDVESSFKLSVSNNFAFTVQNSNGESSSDLDLNIAYETGSKGQATIAVDAVSDCPKDTFTVTVTAFSNSISSSKLFTVFVTDGIMEIVSADGFWLDTLPKMPPFLTSDIEIGMEFDSVSEAEFEIVMKEIDTKKYLFSYSGTWEESENSVYLNGISCKELEKEGDTLKNNPDMCDTIIRICKNIDTSVSPDLWSLKMGDVSFLIEALNMGVDPSLLVNVPLELKRTTIIVDTSYIIISASLNKTFLSSAGDVELNVNSNTSDLTYYYKLNDEAVISSSLSSQIFNIALSGSHTIKVWAVDDSGIESNVITLNVYLGDFPIHSNVTASTFWCGEGASSDNDFITNTQSAWDSKWGVNFGLEDHPTNISRDSDHIPTSSKFTKLENSYYFSLPYNDFGSLVYDGQNSQIDTAAIDVSGHKKNAYNVVYWSDEQSVWNNKSMCKNRWIKITDNESGKTCYAQWEDAGPYYYNDHNYVFGSGSPANNTDYPYAGIDLSPSVSLYFGKHMQEWGAGAYKVRWQFVDAADVPDGPWKKYITTSQVNWD